jgi:hypothetical protein
MARNLAQLSSLGSEGRYRLGSMSTVVFGRTYPAVERDGASACAKPSRIALCTPILQMRVHLKMWLPKISTIVPQAQIGWLVVRCRGRRSFRLMPVSNCQLRRWLCGLLRHNPIRGYDECGESRLGRRWNWSGALEKTSLYSEWVTSARVTH